MRYECQQDGCGYSCNTLGDVMDHVDERTAAGEPGHRLRDIQLNRRRPE